MSNKHLVRSVQYSTLVTTIDGHTVVYTVAIVPQQHQRVIAHAAATRAGYWNVRDVAVDRGWRELGIGFRLMRELLDECARVDMNVGELLPTALSVEPDNDAAIRLYRSLDFRHAFTNSDGKHWMALTL